MFGSLFALSFDMQEHGGRSQNYGSPRLSLLMTTEKLLVMGLTFFCALHFTSCSSQNDSTKNEGSQDIVALVTASNWRFEEYYLPTPCTENKDTNVVCSQTNIKEKFITNSEITFDASKNLNLTAPCNTFDGQYSLNSGLAKISIGKGTTRACDITRENEETQVKTLLANATTYEYTSNGLKLKTTRGSYLLLKKIK